MKKELLAIKISGIIFTSLVIFYLTYSNIKANLIHLYFLSTLGFQVSLSWEIFLMFLRRLDMKIKWDESLKKRFFVQIIGGTIVILIAFTVIQFLIYPLDKLIINRNRLHGYWDFDIFICFLLALIIQLVYIIYYFFFHWRKITQSKENKIGRKKFISRIGNRQIVLSEKEILCFFTENKTVFAFTENSNKHILDISLEEIIYQVNSTEFYRANRQYIIRKSGIKGLKSEPNNRLLIETVFNSDIPNPIIVSRKNTPQFRKWFNT
jgi:hypothetical protein